MKGFIEFQNQKNYKPSRLESLWIADLKNNGNKNYSKGILFEFQEYSPQRKKIKAIWKTSLAQ